MKLSVSNIAWGNKNFSSFLKLIKDQACDGVEIAPSLIWPEPIDSTGPERLLFQNQLKEFDLELVGFHSLLYSRPDLQFFLNTEIKEKTIKYIYNLIQLCSDLGGKHLIFGSPRNRLLHGKKYEECIKQIYEDFYKISEHGKKYQVYFCIEPLFDSENEFIKTLDEGGKIVNKINHPFFKLHIDTKTIFSASEDPVKIINNYINVIQHVHVSDQNLSEPGTKNVGHDKIGAALRQAKFNNYVSIEMRKKEQNNEKAIKNSICFVRKNYLNKL